MNHTLPTHVPPLSVPPRAAWKPEQSAASPPRRARRALDEQNNRRTDVPVKYDQLPSTSSRTQQVEKITDWKARNRPAHPRPFARNVDQHVGWQPSSPPTTHSTGEGYHDRHPTDHPTWTRRDGSMPDQHDPQRPAVPVTYETLPFTTDWTDQANNSANNRVAETDTNHLRRPAHKVDRHVAWQSPAKTSNYLPGEEYLNSDRATSGSRNASERFDSDAGLARYTHQVDEGDVTDAKSLARTRHNDDLYRSYPPRAASAVGPRFRSATTHQQYGQFAGNYDHYDANAHSKGHHRRSYDAVDTTTEHSRQIRANHAQVDSRQNLPLYHHHYSRGLW